MMWHRELQKLDPQQPYRSFFTGFYERDVCLPDGKVRKLLTYIPSDVQTSTAGIFLLPPSGVSAQEFLEKSNWVQLADSEETKEKFVLFVLESDLNGWDIREPYGVENGDVAYLMAAFRVASGRDIVCVHEAKYYMVGYQDGGTLAQMAAMLDPARYAGLAAVDAPPLDPAYLAQAGEAYAVNLMGFEDPAHSKGIRKRDIPLPVWLIGSDWLDDAPEADYWRKACGCDEPGHQFDRDTHAWVRTAETPYPANQEKKAYRVWTSRIPQASERFGERMNRRIWKDFLYGVRRWMADPGGSLRLTQDPVRDLGMEYHYEPVDGWMREWYVYVPRAVRETSAKPVPLVFAIHGYGCSGEIYIGNSGWHTVADRYGFIVVYPTAIYGHIKAAGGPGQLDSAKNIPMPTWNSFGHEEGRPYELNFFEYMLESVCRRYAVDRSRVYATGHSNGSMMVSWLALAKPEMFAAVAPCSGILYMGKQELALAAPEVKTRARTDLPVWMFGGTEEQWLLDGVPASGNRTGASIHRWWEFNEMLGDKPSDFSKPERHAGRWCDWFYEKNGVPMVRFTGIEYFPHATMPEMSLRIWEEFFSRLARVDGKIKYSKASTAEVSEN